MFKKIPGTTGYLINLKFQVIDSFGNIVFQGKRPYEQLTIELFGISKTVTYRWLALLAWYECGVIPNLHLYLDDINFYPIIDTLRVRCGYLMVFENPITYCKDFRIVPSYPRYAVNPEGVLLDIVTNLAITDIRPDTSGYNTYYIRSPDRCDNRNIRVHRLLALAWLRNKDFINRPIINHIDGNKINNSLKNLEWCSFSENSLHALDTGLNACRQKMKSRDVITKEVVVYNSVTEMAAKLFMPNICASNLLNKLPGYLFKGRYEIKSLDDNSAWYFEKRPYNPEYHGKSIFSIKVLNKENGEFWDFSTCKGFCKHFKIKTDSGRLDHAVSVFKLKYPSYEVSYTRNAVCGPYYVFDVIDNSCTEFKTIHESAKYIGRTRTELQYDLSRRWKFIYAKRWVVIPVVKRFNIKEYTHKASPVYNILVTEEKSGTKIIQGTLRTIARELNLERRTILKYIKLEKSFKGMFFRLLD